MSESIITPLFIVFSYHDIRCQWQTVELFQEESFPQPTCAYGR